MMQLRWMIGIKGLKIELQNSITRENLRVLMTSFYRETIKKRNKNVSLTEAVVDLYKQSYFNGSRDVMKLNKARKSTDYKRLDTLAFKLQGGPFSTLYLDIMKYPEYLFSDETLDDYKYSFDSPTTINNKLVYVVNFIKIPDEEPLNNTTT